MAAIWRWGWRLAVLSLWPLAVGTHIQTRTPGQPGERYACTAGSKHCHPRAARRGDRSPEEERRRVMRYVIIAMTDEGGALLYFCGNGFKPNLMHAARFRTEGDAQRRCQKSVICRRLLESGGRIEVRKVASA